MDRISKISENESITITSLEKKIGASKGVLSRAIVKKTDILSKWVQAVVENYPQYSAEWLLTGRGSMLRGNTDNNISKLLPEQSEILAYMEKQLKEKEKEIGRLNQEIGRLKALVSVLGEGGEGFEDVGDVGVADVG